MKHLLLTLISLHRRHCGSTADKMTTFFYSHHDLWLHAALCSIMVKLLYSTCTLCMFWTVWLTLVFFFPSLFTAIEVNLQKALAEASETCTQECLILGHSDSCWMPPALAQFQGPGSSIPTSTPIATAISGTMPSFGFQQSCARGAKVNMVSMEVMDGRHTLGRSVPKKDELDKGINRPQFYNTLDRHCSKKEDPFKVIPLASFSSPGQQTPTGGGSSSFLHEHQL